MEPIRLAFITLENFRSFETRTTLSFPENGLVLLEGPSGAGKSTVLMGIAYALGYSPYPATELKSWHSDKPMEVMTKLYNTKEGTVNLQRGNNTILLTEDKAVKGASAVNAKLPQLLGMNTELLAALTYRPQKTAGLFLSKTNSEMQDFLTTLLDLGKYEKAIEASQEQVKELQSKYIQYSESLVGKSMAHTALQLDMPSYGKAPESLKPFEKQVAEALTFIGEHKEIVARLQEENDLFLGVWQNEIKEVKAVGEMEVAALHDKKPVIAPTRNEKISKLEEGIELGKRRLAKLEESEIKRRAIWLAAINDAESNIRKYEEIAAALPKLKQRQAKLEAEIAKLEQSTCPRCEQPWIEAAMESDLVQSKEDLEEIENQIDASLSAPLSIVGWQETLAIAKTTYDQVDPKIEQFKKIVHDLDVERFVETCTLQEKFNTTVAEWEQQIQTVRLNVATRVNQINHVHQATYEAKQRVLGLATDDRQNALELWGKATAALKEVEYRNDTAKREWEAFAKRDAKATQEVKEASEKVKAAEDALSMEQDFLELLKSFLTAIFDEVLAEIAWNTNEMLKNVPNVAHVTIGFRSESTTGKGTIRRAIVPYVTIDGVERNPKTALSGGMSTAVELAVDLAVRKVISARTGVKPGWLVLDECLAGIDAPVKEACLGLLQQAAQDILILVVEHDSEFKEMFSKRITVTSVGGRSQIVSDDGTNG
jgi:DNA repair exonuclease SbcCD ATPase subunit